MTLCFQRKHFSQKDQAWTQYSPQTAVLWTHYLGILTIYMGFMKAWEASAWLEHNYKIFKEIRIGINISQDAHSAPQCSIQIVSCFQKGKLMECPHSSEHSAASKAKKNPSKPKQLKEEFRKASCWTTGHFPKWEEVGITTWMRINFRMHFSVFK